MSRSQSSSEDQSSGDNSSDEGSGDESESESGSSSGSGSGSGSGDESNSDSDSHSSSGSGSSGSGSSSGEDDDNGSSSEDSGDSEEEDGEEGETEENQLAKKREDFEKMKEMSAHMDNIVQRLAAFFPQDEKHTNAPDPPAVSELPALPLPPAQKVVDRSVSARLMTMDRAASARRLTIDRAVSVASGMHFDDDLSASTVSNTRYENQQNTGTRRAAGDGQGVVSRTQSATGLDWAGRDRSGSERRVGDRGQHQADEAFASQGRGRRESWQGNERHANGAGEGLGPKEEPGGGRRRSRISPSIPGADFGAEGWHERLLWDDLRESLEGAAGNERIPTPGPWARSVAVEKTKEERNREQRRRRLIDEAIAVLLEGSSSSSSSNSDGERLEDDVL